MALVLAASACSVAEAQLVLSLTTAGAGSVTIPAGYDWTNVTVQCWGGGGGGGSGGSPKLAAAAAAALYSTRPTQPRSSPGHIAVCRPRRRRRQRQRGLAATAEVQFGTTAGRKTLLPAAAAG